MQLFRQPILEVDQVNKNGRIYTQEAVDSMLSSSLSIYGRLGMESDSELKLLYVSHSVKLYQEEKTVYADVETLATPNGKNLDSLIESGCPIEFRTNGVGELKKDSDGNQVVGKDYRLISIDAIVAK